MIQKSALVHDIERTGRQWRALLKESQDLPVLERAYRSVIILLLTAGLKGLAGVKTAEIASMSGVNESTLFRYVDKRDELVAESVDWCWKQVNDRVAAAHYACPQVGASAQELIMTDLRAVVEMYREPAQRLCGTGAFLSYRRAEQLTSGFESPHQMMFRRRLVALCENLVSDCQVADTDPEIIATYLTNYLATVWFTWMADPQSKGIDGLLGPEFVVSNLQMMLGRFSSCSFSSLPYNKSQWNEPINATE